MCIRDRDWIDANNKIYNVTKQFGDYGKDVFITEFGKTDMGIDSLDESQGEELYDFILCAAKNLPYVKMFGVFRLLNDPDAERCV